MVNISNEAVEISILELLILVVIDLDQDRSYKMGKSKMNNELLLDILRDIIRANLALHYDHNLKAFQGASLGAIEKINQAIGQPQRQRKPNPQKPFSEPTETFSVSPQEAQTRLEAAIERQIEQRLARISTPYPNPTPPHEREQQQKEWRKLNGNEQQEDF